MKNIFVSILTIIILIFICVIYCGAANLEIVAQLSECPGNITVTPENRIIISLHPFYSSKNIVVELTIDGKVIPFPSSTKNSDKQSLASLDSVLGVQSDTNGVVWMLDNGFKNGSHPKLVGWNSRKNELEKTIKLRPPAVPPDPVFPDNFFLNDLAVDLTHNSIFISHSAGIDESALIVVDLATGNARRVLQGHSSMIPNRDKDNFKLDGRILNYTLPDSGQLKLLIGVNPIALDSKNEWLYYGTLTGKNMYRIKTTDLIDNSLSYDELSKGIEIYSEKPSCDGISIDKSGNIYICDLEQNAIGVIKPDRSYSILVSDPRISWPESFSFGADGFLYFVASQLHLSGPLNNGMNKAKPPFYVFRIKPLAEGVVGR